MLRQRPLPQGSPPLAPLTEDVTWLHTFLARLAALGFPSPRPLPAFGGRAWITAENALWEIVSFIPGRIVGWASEPPMEEVGALLARYHTTVRRIDMPSQRPSALPLSEVPAIVLSDRPEATGVSPDRAAAIRDLAQQIARGLLDAGHQHRSRLVIHGDFTNHNVIADGSRPRTAGVIDFALAHTETPLADIGYGLWRSGRPHQHADHLDLPRVQAFLRGYTSVIPLSAGDASLIPLYTAGRGLQMIAKRIRAGRPETGMLAQTQWVTAHASTITDAITAATGL